MTARPTAEVIEQFSRLAMFSSTPEEVQVMVTGFAELLDRADELGDLDLEDVEPMTHPFARENVFRDDVVGDTLDREVVLAAAPAVEHHQFRVPAILDVDA